MTFQRQEGDRSILRKRKRVFDAEGDAGEKGFDTGFRWLDCEKEMGEKQDDAVGGHGGKGGERTHL